MAPDLLKENVLGYRLEWIQDNVTQVTVREGSGAIGHRAGECSY